MQPLTAEQPVSLFHSYLTFDRPWYFTDPGTSDHPKDADYTVPQTTITSNFLDMLPKRYAQSAAPAIRRSEVATHQGSKSAPNEREWKKALRDKRDIDKQSELKLLNRRNKMEPMKASEPVKRSSKYSHVKSRVDSNLQHSESAHELSTPKNHYRSMSESTGKEFKNNTQSQNGHAQNIELNVYAPSNRTPSNDNPTDSSTRTHSAILWRPGATASVNQTSTPEETMNRHRRVLSAYTYKEQAEAPKLPPQIKSAKDRAKSASAMYANIMQENYQRNMFLRSMQEKPEEIVKSQERVSVSIEAPSSSYSSRPYSYRSYNSNTTDISPRSNETVNSRATESSYVSSYRSQNEDLTTNDSNYSPKLPVSNGKYYDNYRAEVTNRKHYETSNPNNYDKSYNKAETQPPSTYDPIRQSVLLSKFPALSDDTKNNSVSMENLQVEPRETSNFSSSQENISMESRSLSLPNLRSASGSTYYYKQRHPNDTSNDDEENDETKDPLNVISSSSPSKYISRASELENKLQSKVDELNKKLNVNRELLSHEVESSNNRRAELPTPRKMSYASKYLQDSIDISLLVPVEFQSNNIADSRRKSQSEASLPSVGEATNRMYSWLDSIPANSTKKQEETARHNRTWDELPQAKEHLPLVKKPSTISASMPANLNYVGVEGRSKKRSILKRSKKVHIDLDCNRIYVYTPEYDMPLVKWSNN